MIEKVKGEHSVNVEQSLCAGLSECLKQNELMLVENDKGRATCIIESKNVEELIEKDLSNKQRYIALKKRPNRQSKNLYK